jgi:hypothetical protein
MGFASYQDMVDEINAGKFFRCDWYKIASASTGVASSWGTFWDRGHSPAAGAYSGTALNAQQTSDATTGAIWHGGDVSPDTKHLIEFTAAATAATSIPGYAILVDRLLYYPGISATSTSPQNLVNGVAIQRYTSGVDVKAWLEVTTVLGTGTGTFTMDYTSDVDSGRALGATVNTVASSIITNIPHARAAINTYASPFLPLQAGDSGVKSVQQVTFTAAHTGSTAAVALVLGVALAWVPLSVVSLATERDFAMGLASLPRVFDGACLGIIYGHNGNLVASSPYMGRLGFAWG